MRVGQRRSTLKGLLAGDLVARALFHFHGVEPLYADDLRFATQQEWDAPWGDHPVTKNGDPQLVPSIGATDDDAFDFDGVDDYLSVPDDPSLDFGAGDSFSVGHLFQTTQGSSQRFASKEAVDNANDPGWSTSNGGSPATFGIRITDTNNTDAEFGGTVKTDDGAPHTGIGVRDGAVDEIRNIVDGTLGGTTTGAPSGSLANAKELALGAKSGGGSYFAGQKGVDFVHPEWISVPQAAFLDALLRTGNHAPGAFARLRSMIYGHRETGFKRRIPSYLVDAFGAGGPQAALMADRVIHGIDGEGLPQLSNAVGTLANGGGIQRTSSEQALVNGSTTRGQPADSLQSDATTRYDIQGYPSDPTEMTYAAVWRRDTTDNLHGLINAWSSSTSARLSFYDAFSNNRVTFTAEDSNGNRALIGTVDGIDTSAGFNVAVMRFDKAAGEIHGYFRNATDGTLTKMASASFTGNFQMDFNRYLNIKSSTNDRGLNGPVKFLGWDPTDIGETAAKQLRDDLFNRYAS